MDELLARFPDMKPVTSLPTLFSINGCGLTMVGRRDYDPETGTYVKTQCISLLFIPVIPVGAYRVADSGNGGWYCIGQVPVSSFARGAGLVFVLAVLAGIGGIWWNAHTNSPGYKAGRMLAEADALAADGKPGRAAELYRDVLTGPTDRAGEAKQKLVALITDPPPPPAEAATIYRVAADLHRQNRCPVPDLFARGADTAKKFADAEPAAALAVLEAIAPFAPKPEDELALREQLLTRLVAADPANPEPASKLAAVFEQTGRRDKCESLLTPHEAKLGKLEGAAILGRIHHAAGRPEKALPLLKQFVDGRLNDFLQADASLTATETAAQTRVVDQLKRGAAAGFDFDRYDRLDKNAKLDMVQDYINARLKDDPGLRDARQAVYRHAAVVPAALDLGLLQLEQGQSAADPAARTAALEAAEKTFLSIRGAAGESAAYKLRLGQVYYWLGKSADGEKLFNELLAGANRAPPLLLQVAHTLREVGNTSEARKLAAEAYTAATEENIKQTAARVRAIIPIDLDDSITWLERAGTAPETQASLAYHRGVKAARAGDDATAVNQLRQAIDIYARMPESTASLNNSALAHFELHRVAHDPEEFTRGAAKLDRAVALVPSDSILLVNAAHVLMETAARDVVGDAIDLQLLNRSAGWDLLPFLYADTAGRKPLTDRVARHPGAVKARGYLERLMVLAPKRDDAYRQLTALFTVSRSESGLTAVRDRLARTELDLAQEAAEYRDYLSGKRDAKLLEDNKNSLARSEKALADARGKKGPTFAAAVAAVLRGRTTAWTLGQKVDPAELVTLAEEAYAAAPSDGSLNTLVSALTFRAHATLAARDAAYAKEADRTKRTTGMGLVMYALSMPGPHREKLLADPAVKRMQDLVAASAAQLPDEVGPTTWAVLAAGRKEATTVADRLKADAVGRLLREIERALAPHSADGVFAAVYTLRAAGKDAEATKLLKETAGKNIPVPGGG